MQGSRLTDQEMQEISQLLGRLFVPLEEDKALQGLGYIRERLMLCRAMLDQVHDIRLRVVLASTKVQTELIFAQHTATEADTLQAKTQWKAKIAELKQVVLAHKALAQLVGAQQAMLMQTQRDIKSLGEIIKEQLKLAEVGGVNPDEAHEELVTQVDLAQVGKPLVIEPEDNIPCTAAEEAAPQIDLSPFMEPEPEVVPEDQIPEQPEEDADQGWPLEGEFAGLFAPVAQKAPVPVATETVSFGDDVVLTVAETAPRGIRVPDLSAVPIESLFEEETNGQGGAPTPAYRAF